LSLQVAIAMGSDSDWRVLESAKQTLTEFGVSCEIEVLSAHRTPERMLTWGAAAAERGIQVVIAGAGGAAHLPGMLAAVTRLPVIGVPISLQNLDGLDSLLSIAQMPAGVPVATMAIDGAKNAALMALRILSLSDSQLASRLDAHRKSLAEAVAIKNIDLKKRIS
jgi:5-(carboxyamino)imidazole ribonucleotide mutase